MRNITSTYAPLSNQKVGRETYLVRVHWENDWPVFNYGQKISLLTFSSMDAKERIKPLQPSKSLIWKSDFSKETLEPGWYQKSRILHHFKPFKATNSQIDTPLKQFYSLAERPNHLRVYGGCYTLSSPEAPTMLLRKQTAINQSFQATLEFRPRKAGYEAGIVVWWSMYSYASIGLTHSAVDGVICVIERNSIAVRETQMV